MVLRKENIVYQCDKDMLPTFQYIIDRVTKTQAFCGSRTAFNIGIQQDGEILPLLGRKLKGIPLYKDPHKYYLACKDLDDLWENKDLKTLVIEPCSRCGRDHHLKNCLG